MRLSCGRDEELEKPWSGRSPTLGWPHPALQQLRLARLQCDDGASLTQRANARMK